MSNADIICDMIRDPRKIDEHLEYAYALGSLDDALYAENWESPGLYATYLFLLNYRHNQWMMLPS